MATAEKPPFSWHSVESLPDLERLRLVLDVLPDEEIVAALEAGRGRGRNDYPVSAMRRAPIAGVVFQHPSIRSLLRELGRNPALLELCGFEALPFRGAPLTELRAGTQGPPCAVTHPARVRSTVPSHWNFSRFLTGVVQLEKEQGLVSAMIESLRSSLFEEVPDFGRHLGCDGKAIESHSTGRVAEGKKDASDPDADRGKHETSGVNARTGKIWKKVKSWFGYGLHPIADTHYEVPVAFEVTRASRTETKVLAAMLEGLFAEAPEMAERGACGTIKYRCPAAAFGVNCVGSKACRRAGGVKPGEYGRIVRVDLDNHDRRIFTPTPWGSPSWRRGYKRRSAMERINSRLDNSFNFETHYISGLAKMKTRVGLALAVMMALALGRVRAGHAGRMHSPVGAVPYPDTG